MKKFVNLYELFGNIFNRHFKSYYYNEDIANMFQYNNSLFFKNFIWIIKNYRIPSNNPHRTVKLPLLRGGEVIRR